MLPGSEIAYVSLGSNMGNRVEHIMSAIDEMETPGVTEVFARSSLYLTVPIGFSEQPDFINCVVSLRTKLRPISVLRRLHKIEQAHGRVRSRINGPRTLDLDLLLHGQSAMRERRLQIPHPRLHEREFVLRPLVEIRPDIWIPGHGTAQECLSRCRNQGVTLLSSLHQGSVNFPPVATTRDG